MSTTPKTEGDKASVLSNVANILGVSGAQEGRVATPDEQALAKMGVEPDQHPIMYFWGFLAAVTLFVVVAVAGVWQFVGMSTQAEVLRQLQNLQDGVSGVSLDEEAADMLRFQRGYEANARFFTTVNQMLDTLIGMMR